MWVYEVMLDKVAHESIESISSSLHSLRARRDVIIFLKINISNSQVKQQTTQTKPKSVRCDCLVFHCHLIPAHARFTSSRPNEFVVFWFVKSLAWTVNIHKMRYEEPRFDSSLPQFFCLNNRKQLSTCEACAGQSRRIYRRCYVSMALSSVSYWRVRVSRAYTRLNLLDLLRILFVSNVKWDCFGFSCGTFSTVT